MKELMATHEWLYISSLTIIIVQVQFLSVLYKPLLHILSLLEYGVIMVVRMWNLQNLS